MADAVLDDEELLTGEMADAVLDDEELLTGEIADAVLDDERCLLPTCNRSGPLNTFKVQAVKKLIECATERHDDETGNKMQAWLF